MEASCGYLNKWILSAAVGTQLSASNNDLIFVVFVDMENLTNGEAFDVLQILCCHLAHGPGGARRGMFQLWLRAVLVLGRSLFVVWAVLGAVVAEQRGWSTAAAAL